MTQSLLIEVASDVICPWCYIGKRRLEKALAQVQAIREAVVSCARPEDERSTVRD